MCTTSAATRIDSYIIMPFFKGSDFIIIFFAARVAFGVEAILGAFACGTKRPLRELRVLDAGMC